MPPRWVTEDVISRLRERLGLSDEQLSPSDIPFIPAVIATTDVDIVRRIQDGIQEPSATFAAGLGSWVDLYTVPAGKVLIPQSIAIIRNSGDNTFRDVAVYDGSDRVTIHLTASGQTEFTIGKDKVPTSVKAGERIQTRLDGAGAAQTVLYTEIWGVLEDA